MARLRKSLERKQDKHARLLRRIEKASTRLDRFKTRLGALETAIADLERRVAEPRRRRSATSEVTAGSRRARLIFNPASGRHHEQDAERLSQIVRSLRAHGIEASVGLRTSGKAARTLAREALREKCPLVIVAAGDGTIGQVASQLVGTDTVIGIVPIGTMNNLARSLGVPLEIEKACELIGMGTTRHVDIGRAHTDGAAHDEYFLESAGLGLSAIGALAGQSFFKRRWRILPRAMSRFFGSNLGRVRIEMDDGVVEARTRIVTVCNAPIVANNLLLAAGARMDDGLLDVAVYDGMDDTELVARLQAGAAHKPLDVPTWRTRRLRIVTEKDTPSHADMHVRPERREVEIEAVPAALSMIVGNGIGLTLPVEAAPEAPAFAPDPAAANGSRQEDVVPPAPVRS